MPSKMSLAAEPPSMGNNKLRIEILRKLTATFSVYNLYIIIKLYIILYNYKIVYIYIIYVYMICTLCHYSSS